MMTKNGIVDVVPMFTKLIISLTVFFTLCIILPPLFILKICFSVLNTIFQENMESKVVLITGASSGIGEQIAYQYAKRGACLALVARRERSLQEVAERAKVLGSPDVFIVRADVSKADECKAFVEQIMNHFGRLDHLVNNAGIACVTMFENCKDITDFTALMDVNFWGTVYPTFYSLPHLKKSRGRIAVTASATGWLPMPRMSFYNASKAALISFYDTLRIEIGPEVGVTILNPGWIESDITKGKFFSGDGTMQLDQEMIEIEGSVLPVESAQDCAEAIVLGVCRGDRYVTEPAWFKVMSLYSLFAPEILEWCFRVLFISKSGSSDKEALSKRILDATGAKNILYPSSTDIKRE